MPAPTAVSITHSATELSVAFTAVATGAVSYAWDFNDGNSGTGQSITHQYKVPGTYTVTLTATASDAATTNVTKTITITRTTATHGFVMRDLKAVGFYEEDTAADRDDYQYDAAGSNIQKVDYIQAGINMRKPTNVARGYSYGELYETRNTQDPTPTIDIPINLGATHVPPDNSETGPRYVLELFFENAHGERLWIQYDQVRRTDDRGSIPAGGFLGEVYTYEGTKRRIITTVPGPIYNPA